jgi:hypothetical protein
MDGCEEDVIIACGLYLLAEEEKQKKNENYLLLNCYRNLCAVNYTSTPVLVPK